MGNSTTIGDSQEQAVQPAVIALPQSIVTAAQLADVDDPVNLKIYSGKKMGATYAYEVDTDVMELVMASGPEPTDPWVKMSGLGALTALALTVAGDVGDAAGITVQLNLIEAAINGLVTGLVITPA